MERVYKSPELPKTVEKLESSAYHDLGNIQNTTTNMNLTNTTLLYREDNSCGLSGNACNDHMFFHKGVLF